MILFSANFNPRSPCGERPGWTRFSHRQPDFNPRSPCGERLGGAEPGRENQDFNPRSPCGERHQRFVPSSSPWQDFNPRSPCGERHILVGIPVELWQFQSTLSLRRATIGHRGAGVYPGISIHALLAESDQRRQRDLLHRRISIHALLAESDHHHPDRAPGVGISIHALLAESDQVQRGHNRCRQISIHALLAESDSRRKESPGHRHISIHALLAESDTAPVNGAEGPRQFQSTLSLRRATANTTKLALSFLSKVPI